MLITISLIFILENIKHTFSSSIQYKDCSDIQSAIKELNNFYKTVEENKRQGLLQGIGAGSILCKVKRLLTRKEFLQFVSKTRFSLSWSYFLIRLYTLAENFPGIQQCSISLYEFKKNMKIICKNIKKEPYSILWKDIIIDESNN